MRITKIRLKIQTVLRLNYTKKLETYKTRRNTRGLNNSIQYVSFFLHFHFNVSSIPYQIINYHKPELVFFLQFSSKSKKNCISEVFSKLRGARWTESYCSHSMTRESNITVANRINPLGLLHFLVLLWSELEEIRLLQLTRSCRL